MGKSSKQKQRVVDYFMSMHFGICLATPNTRLRKILIGEKVAWSGDESQQVTFTVNQPDLFGGVQKEGGVKGTIDYLPGKSDQVLSPQLAARLGGTPSTVPGFRGITSIFFTGLQTLAFSPNFRNPGRLGYAANQALANADAANYNNGAYGSYSTTSATQSGGFKWSSNNPIIQSVWCQVTSIPETLSTQYAAIGDHANPAHIIYEALVDTDFGGNIAPSQINTAMFNAAAQTLYNENFGLSLIWTGQSSIEDFVKEILDHIQATLYINPKNGLFELKLLRADYIEANLRVLNVDNSFVTDDQRKFWGETANEIVVSWTNPENEQTETVIEQDLANIANQGAVISTSKNYYGVRTKELAKTLAQRDLRQSAYPLASVTLKADRSCWDIVPGEVVKVDHSSDSISPMIMRVLTVDYGKIGSGNIIISLLEDIFSLNVARPITPPGSLYDPNAEEPAAITNYKIFTPPAHWLMKNDPTALKKLTAGESLVGVLGYSSQKTATSFNLAVQSTDTLGNQYWQIGDRKNLTGLGSLSTALAIENSSLIDKLPKTGAFAPNQGDWLILGDDLSEICLVGALETNGWRIYRGMLDTIPKNWSIGSPFRLVPANLNVLDTIHERAVNETCNYMLLTNTEGGQLSTGVAPVSTGVASDRLLRPIRPANVQINGLSTSSIAVSPTGNMTITWANRNRYSEEVTPLKFTDGAVTPEYKQRTLIRVKTTAGVLIREYVHLWNDNTYIIPCSWYAKYASVIVEVLSERYGYESLSKYSYTITGLANNAGASDPPAVTAAGIPPPGFNGAGEPVSWEDLIDTDGTKPMNNADVTATSAAMVAAMAAINNIVSDGILGKEEKPYLVEKFTTIKGEYDSNKLQNLASTLAISTELTSFVNSYLTLKTYIESLNPLYNDYTSDTAIVRSTFVSTISNYYTSKIALETACDAKAATLSTWSGITNKPSNISALNGTEKIDNNLLSILIEDPTFSQDGKYWTEYADLNLFSSIPPDILANGGSRTFPNGTFGHCFQTVGSTWMASKKWYRIAPNEYYLFNCEYEVVNDGSLSLPSFPLGYTVFDAAGNVLAVIWTLPSDSWNDTWQVSKGKRSISRVLASNRILAYYPSAAYIKPRLVLNWTSQANGCNATTRLYRAELLDATGLISQQQNAAISASKTKSVVSNPALMMTREDANPDNWDLYNGNSALRAKSTRTGFDCPQYAAQAGTMTQIVQQIPTTLKQGTNVLECDFVWNSGVSLAAAMVYIAWYDGSAWHDQQYMLSTTATIEGVAPSGARTKPYQIRKMFDVNSSNITNAYVAFIPLHTGYPNSNTDRTLSLEWLNIRPATTDERNANSVEYGADVTANAQITLSGLLTTTFDFSAGSPVSGQLPRNIQARAYKGGTEVTANGTWSITNMVNCTVTVSNAAGTNGSESITALSGTGQVERSYVRVFTYNGISYQQKVTIAYNNIDTAAVSSKAGLLSSFGNTIASSTWGTVATSGVLTISNAPANSIVSIEGGIGFQWYSGNDATVNVRLKIDGAVVYTGSAQSVMSGGMMEASDFSDVFTYQHLSALSAGTHTFSIEAQRTAGTGSVVAIGNLKVTLTGS